MSELVPWDAIINNNARQYNVGTKSVQKELSQEAINKLIYDALSSDHGLASLASGENLTGGSKSSSKTLLAQDMMTKLIGELASVTAKNTETIDLTTDKESKQGRKLSVICTELNRQGKLEDSLYEAGGAPWTQVSYYTYLGYSVWATRVVPLMARSEGLSNALLPVVRSRYLLLTSAPGLHILGRLTKWIGEPACWLIGQTIFAFSMYQALRGVKNGRAS